MKIFLRYFDQGVQGSGGDFSNKKVQIFPHVCTKNCDCVHMCLKLKQYRNTRIWCKTLIFFYLGVNCKFNVRSLSNCLLFRRRRKFVWIPLSSSSIIFSWWGWGKGSPSKPPPQSFQKHFKGNYAENFFVQKVNALTCSLCLVISLV